MELRIDRACVDRCRALAAAIVAPVEAFIAAHSTVSVERAVLRLLGVDGITPEEIPLPNAIVDSIAPDERGRGIAIAFGKAVAETGLDPCALAEAVAAGRYTIAEFRETPASAARGALRPHVANALARIATQR